MKMAYMRGVPYVYSTGGTMEIYAEGHVSLPIDQFDALVLMRFAQILDRGHDALEEEMVRVAGTYAGNFGCDALLKLLGQPTVMDYLRERFQRKMTDDGM